MPCSFSFYGNYEITGGGFYEKEAKASSVAF